MKSYHRMLINMNKPFSKADISRKETDHQDNEKKVSMRTDSESKSDELSTSSDFPSIKLDKKVPLPKTFPKTLMDVLNEEEFSHIVTWRPDGESFAILKPREFCEEILPIHWKKVKYMSFLRKLHRWGFTCDQTENGRKVDVFTHEFFKREKPELVDKMKPTPAPTPAGKQIMKPQSLLMQKTAGYSANDRIAPPPFNRSSASVMHPGNPTGFQRPLPTFSSIPNTTGFHDRNQMPVAQRISPLPNTNLIPAPAGRRISVEDSSMLEMSVELEVTRRLRESISHLATARRQEQQQANALEEQLIQREYGIRLEARLHQESRLKDEQMVRLQVEQELQAQYRARQNRLGAVPPLAPLDGMGLPGSQISRSSHRELMQEVMIDLERRKQGATVTNAIGTHRPFHSSHSFGASHVSQLDEQCRLDSMAAAEIALLSRSAPTSRQMMGFERPAEDLYHKERMSAMMGGLRYPR